MLYNSRFSREQCRNVEVGWWGSRFVQCGLTCASICGVCAQGGGSLSLRGAAPKVAVLPAIVALRQLRSAA